MVQPIVYECVSNISQLKKFWFYKQENSSGREESQKTSVKVHRVVVQDVQESKKDAKMTKGEGERETTPRAFVRQSTSLNIKQ